MSQLVSQGHVAATITLRRNTALAVFQACRTYQWVKNSLIFVPLIASHQLTNGALFLEACFAFVAFGLCASSIYVVNDLLDLEHDRQHPEKRHRPFASGALDVKTGIVLAAMLLTSSFLLAWFVLPKLFSGVLVLYFVTSNLYSFRLKRIAVLDVLVLAGLYTLRIIAGGVALGIAISNWLLAFSIFLFLSLAFLKRFTELQLMQNLQRTEASGRGYTVVDIELIKNLGPSCGYLAVLVLALYIHGSGEVASLYRHPDLLWLIGPCLLYWITRMWLLANRGLVTGDPIVFAVRDRASYAAGAFAALIVVLASVQS